MYSLCQGRKKPVLWICEEVDTWDNVDEGGREIRTHQNVEIHVSVYNIYSIVSAK
jgi:hypothetical protein